MPPAQRLARAVARLAALEDPEDLVRETVRAALDVAGFESAMLALDDGHGDLYAHHAEGSFGVVFADLGVPDLAAISQLGQPRHVVLHRQRGHRPRVRRP